MAYDIHKKSNGERTWCRGYKAKVSKRMETLEPNNAICTKFFGTIISSINYEVADNNNMQYSYITFTLDTSDDVHMLERGDFIQIENFGKTLFLIKNITLVVPKEKMEYKKFTKTSRITRFELAGDL